jgi:hypothetical protein
MQPQAPGLAEQGGNRSGHGQGLGEGGHGGGAESLEVEAESLEVEAEMLKN